MALSAYSATPASNTSISGINLAEGCNASGINDAIRQMMADLAVPQFGSLVGIGMTPSNVLDITQTQNAASLGLIKNASAGTGATASWGSNNGTHGVVMQMQGTGYTTSGAFRQDGALFFTDGAGGMSFSVPSDAFRWYIGGSNIMGVSSGGLGVTVGPASASYDGSSVTTTWVGGFSIVASTNGVNLPQNGTAWAAISDYRAKNVYGQFTGAGAIIDAVPVYSAEYTNKTQPIRPMFLAHEVVEGGAAYAVHGEKDAVDAEGAPVFQSLQSTDPLVPIMWAELRALRARVAALEATA